MKPIYKYFSSLFILSFLLIGEITLAQDANMDLIPGKLHDYYVKFPQERLFVHTDKDFYLAGDLLWFKVYHVDAVNHKTVHWSKVAYVELLDHNNIPVWQSKISLQQKEDNGSCLLPFTLSTGNYKLRAYTNWMKNLGPEIYFEKKLTIVNTLKDPEKNTGSNNRYYVDFFPEGGNLVIGVQSKLAFRATNSFGKGINCSGYIVSDKNDTVSVFHPLKFGIGSFMFTPLPDVTYRAIILFDDGAILKKELPKIYDHGYVMNITSKDISQYLVTIHSGLSERNNNDQVYLIGQTKGKINIAQKLFLNNGVSQFVFDKKRAGEGITRMTLFNKNGQPVCERLLFKRPMLSNSINIKPESDSYSTRKKVIIRTTFNDTSLKSSDINMSATIFRIDSLQEESSDIVNYYWLTSELSGNIESPDYYLKSEVAEIIEATDNLMLTHGWRKFNWDRVMHQNNGPVKFPMEYKGHIITAKVTDSRTGQAAGNIQVFLSIPGTHFQFFSGQSDSSGMVRFDVDHYYDNGEMVLQTNTQKDSFYHVEILNPFSESYSEDSSFRLAISKDKLSILEDYHIGMQTQNVFSGDSMRIFIHPEEKDTLPFYGKPSNTYLLDNYTRFTTMEEIFREYVTDINVGVRGGQKFIKILHENEKEFATEDILVLLDGIALIDKSKIFSYDPLKVRKLDIISENYLLGPSKFSGIASFVTYDGNFQGYELDPRDITVDYEGLQLQREFYSPSYDTPRQLSSRIPDFRTTLYWKPDVPVDSNGTSNIQFYSSDRKGSYLIMIQGIDSRGNFISSSSSFSVK